MIQIPFFSKKTKSNVIYKGTGDENLLPVHKRFNIKFLYGKGPYLFTKNDRYLDFGAGIAVNAMGHCHPSLVKAITEQASKLWHVSNIYHIDELEKCAKKLTTAYQKDYAFFCNSGAEAIECAIKMIRRHFYIQNKPERNRIITFAGAFHGRTIAAISAAGKKKYYEGFEPLLEGFDNVEYGNIEAVKKAINKNTAGILIEPIQGEEGIKVPTKKFIRELRKLTKEKGILLAFDEVQCGMGRTGYMGAFEYFGVKPDIISLAKAIGGGFPLGACVSSKFAAKGMTFGTHGTTYGGNPLAMSVSKVIVDKISKPHFLQNIRNTSDYLFSNLRMLQKEFPDKIKEIRGVGLMIGIRFSDKIVNTEFVDKLIENKLLTVAAGENVVRLLPPLIITKKHANMAIKILKKCLK